MRKDFANQSMQDPNGWGYKFIAQDYISRLQRNPAYKAQADALLADANLTWKQRLEAARELSDQMVAESAAAYKAKWGLA